MAKRRRVNIWLPVFAVFMFLLFIFVIFWGVLTGKKVGDEAKNTLPVIKISLVGTSLEEIQENEKNIEYGGNNLEIFNDEVEFFYDNVEIKGHGNFSWNADKKSYRIKFEEKTDLLGMGRKRKWVLVANSVDDTLMRNDLAYFMAELIGSEYQMRGEFVELVVDGEDLGVYYLIKALEIDKQAVDIRETDGVLVEMDNVYCKSEDNWWLADNGDCFTVKDIVTKDNEERVMGEFVDEYNDLLVALAEKDFERVEKRVDLESFAKYFIISELTADPDAYATSWYFYKDGVSDKIYVGPAWDYDAAFGNQSWGEWPERFYDPMMAMNKFEYTYEKKEQVEGVCPYNKEAPLVETINVSWTMCDFLEMPEFREMVSEIYVEDLRGKKDEIINYIREKAEEIGEPARKDAKMWGKGDFDDEVSYLVDWVEKRFDMFDDKYVMGRSSLREMTREL